MNLLNVPRIVQDEVSFLKIDHRPEIYVYYGKPQVGMIVSGVILRGVKIFQDYVNTNHLPLLNLGDEQVHQVTSIVDDADEKIHPVIF